MAVYKEMKSIKFPNSDVVYVITDDNKIQKDQGTSNAGKVLIIGADGMATTEDPKNIETKKPTIDSSLSSTSTNAVQNKVINNAISGMLKYTSQTLTDDQKTRARTNIGAGTSNFSGSYNDLANKPTIPSVDNAMSASSTNTVQNKVIYSALQNKSDSNHTHENMATTGYVDTAISTAIGGAIGGSY